MRLSSQGVTPPEALELKMIRGAVTPMKIGVLFPEEEGWVLSRETTTVLNRELPCLKQESSGLCLLTP